MHGIEGYGAHRQIHTARILDLSGDLPITITAVDFPDKIEAVVPKLDEMIGEGLVTTEEVRIVISRPPLQPRSTLVRARFARTCAGLLCRKPREPYKARAVA